MTRPIHVSRTHLWTWDATAQKWRLKTSTTQKRYTPSSPSWPDFKNSAMASAHEYWTLNTSEWNHTLVPFPNDDAVCSLSDVLETGDVPRRYYLSAKACAGILRRAEKREKELPEALRLALESVASQT
jgi:hypothetical protein